MLGVLRKACHLAVAALALLLAILQPAQGLGLRSMAKMGDCPLCVAEDHCHLACSHERKAEPGSEYCLTSCTGAHPGDVFDEAWFQRADEDREKRRELDESLKRLGRELAEDGRELAEERTREDRSDCDTMWCRTSELDDRGALSQPGAAAGTAVTATAAAAAAA
eukprot:CAMPEP_0206523682 /NCGR_PEP_ID=MMETSP0324_2-20121206/67757_1 /ASSEMBLY_ACC=CAM_ASM_000836 /TAXON_ID=2866 /ORGANISM="Crypthecodinium cohnii, Strain Seligo" /LENGTH=164 /DNA_ID=CAMNT_0054018151 /DNA_START=1 /DNA_END=494 /DNA_ORIENTATION=-